MAARYTAKYCPIKSFRIGAWFFASSAIMEYSLEKFAEAFGRFVLDDDKCRDLRFYFALNIFYERMKKYSVEFIHFSVSLVLFKHHKNIFLIYLSHKFYFIHSKNVKNFQKNNWSRKIHLKVLWQQLFLKYFANIKSLNIY